MSPLFSDKSISEHRTALVISTQRIIFILNNHSSHEVGYHG
ncbi:5961_t:CDS:1, partial [Ambispora leptoticha]